jgi:hypothetical protein
MSVNNVKNHPPHLRPWDIIEKQPTDKKKDFRNTLQRQAVDPTTVPNRGEVNFIDPELVKSMAQYQIQSLNMSLLSAFTSVSSSGPMMASGLGGLSNLSGFLKIFQMSQIHSLMSPWSQNPVIPPTPRVTPKPATEPTETEPEIEKTEETVTEKAEPAGLMKKPEKSAILNLIKKTAKAHGLDPALVRAVIKTESNYDPTAVSHAGAMGLMQLMPSTADDLGVKNPYDPVENVNGGVKYLKQLLDRYSGNVKKALAAYNWGPGNLEKYGSRGNMPRETRNYLRIVTDRYKKYQSGSKA